MDDWLAELRESKKRAIVDAQTSHSRDQMQRDQVETQLRDGQARIIGLLKGMAVEAILQQFIDEILRDHPLFPNSTTMRTVTGKSYGLAEEVSEAAPWSGPLDHNPLAEDLALPNGRQVTRIDWKIRLRYADPHYHDLRSYNLHLSMSARGLHFNGKPVLPATAETLKTTLVHGFQEVTRSAESSKTHRHRRHRHRPWYKRLWTTLFPDRPFSGVYLVIVAMIVVVSVLLALIAVQAISGVSMRWLPSPLW